MEWDGTKISLWNMEDARMERNGRFQNEMEDNLPYFHTNFIQDFVHCIHGKIHTDVGW